MKRILAGIAALSLSHGCTTSSPDQTATTIELRSLFVYEGVRCAVCHKAITPANGKTWVVTVQDHAFVAHRSCCKLTEHE